jgi:hypothetical protein
MPVTKQLSDWKFEVPASALLPAFIPMYSGKK